MQTRNEQISDLFRSEQATVERRVARKANVPAATIEDACSYAWTQLVAHTEVNLTPTWQVLGWLTTVAAREAWRLADRSARTEALDTIGGEVATAAQMPAPENVEQTVIGRDRLRALQTLAANGAPALTERQRLMLLLRAMGYTFDEVAAITGATVRTVDRQVYRAHDRAREHDEDS